MEVFQSGKKSRPDAQAAGRFSDKKAYYKLISGRQVSSIQAARKQAQANSKHQLPQLDRARLDVVYFNGMPLTQVAVALTEMTGQNIVVSEAAAGTGVRVYLKNVSGRIALETICRMNNLWYREEGAVARILTAEEYGKGLTVRRDEQTRIFYLRNAPALSVASMITSLMGDQVEYTEPENDSSFGHVGTDGEDPFDNVHSSSDSDGRSSGSNTRYRSGRYGGGRSIRVGRSGYDRVSDEVRALKSRLSPEMIAKLAATGKSGKEPLAASDVVQKLSLPPAARITVFLRNNCIAARSVDGTILREIGRIIRALDTPTRQV
ncbi:MAG: hypothetical protein K8S55_06940, partial [Phycisphaerae bacterium]|nr:hypothetical protein [Phycisphaerae bacterium]